MLGLVRVMSSLLAIGGREKETQDFYIPLCNGAKITNSGCFYAVFPSIPFRFVEPRKAAPETLQVSATSGMTTRQFSSMEKSNVATQSSIYVENRTSGDHKQSIKNI